MYKDLLEIKEGESTLVRFYDLKDIILLKVHYSSKLNYGPVLCKRYVIGGCPFCNEVEISVSNQKFQFEREIHAIIIFGDIKTMKMRLVYFYDFINAKNIMKSLRKNKTQFGSLFFKLSYLKGEYTIKPVKYMTSKKRILFSKLDNLTFSVRWVVDCSPNHSREDVSRELVKCKDEILKNKSS